MYANSIGPDGTAQNELSHQDLLCLIFGSRLLADIPICNNWRVQIHRRKSSLQRHGGEKLRPL